jgi:hypothetical protein
MPGHVIGSLNGRLMKNPKDRIAPPTIVTALAKVHQKDRHVEREWASTFVMSCA